MNREIINVLFLSPDIQNSLWVGWRWVHGQSGGIQGPRQQLQCLRSRAVLSWCSWGAGRETATAGMDVAPVQDDQTGQQQRLVVVMRTPSYASGQQDAPLPLVVEHQSEQRHHQDEDDGAADDGVGDAGVVAQAIVQCHKVLSWSFWGAEEGDEGQIENGAEGWGGKEKRTVWRRKDGGEEEEGKQLNGTRDWGNGGMSWGAAEPGEWRRELRRDTWMSSSKLFSGSCWNVFCAIQMRGREIISVTAVRLSPWASRDKENNLSVVEASCENLVQVWGPHFSSWRKGKNREPK